MTRVILVIFAFLALAAARPEPTADRVTTIEQFPFSVSMLFSATGTDFRRSCGGSIFNRRTIISAAHCYNFNRDARSWRVRVGSVWANSGGTVYQIEQIFVHEDFDTRNRDSDIAAIRLPSDIVYDGITVDPICMYGGDLPDNEHVIATGWGPTAMNDANSDLQLRHVEARQINQQACLSRYASRGYQVTDNMICSVSLDVSRRDQCRGDSGSAIVYVDPEDGWKSLYGVYSWELDCGDASFPSIGTRLSKFGWWIIRIALPEIEWERDEAAISKSLMCAN